ncbi:hypothetical protein [Thalassococcus sp. BH17M4-6]|uniref:hypothetical protein n=1 Tax=Thalassococcus sp. BH17M4-6 TaxID=3413148 RepID=UPI003BF51BDF
MVPVLAAYILAASVGGMGLALGFWADGATVDSPWAQLPLLTCLVAFVGGVLFIPAFAVLTRKGARSYTAWGLASFVAGQPWWWVLSIFKGYPLLGLVMLATSVLCGIVFRFCLRRYCGQAGQAA